MLIHKQMLCRKVFLVHTGACGTSDIHTGIGIRVVGEGGGGVRQELR